MPCSCSRNVVSVRRAKSARGLFRTGMKAALGAGEVCGRGVTTGEAAPKPPFVPKPAGEPHLCQEISQSQGRDGGVQVTGLIAHHHVDLLVTLDVLLPGQEASGTAVMRPHPSNTPRPVPSPLLPSRGHANVPGATCYGCHPQMPPAGTHLPAATGSKLPPGISEAPTGPALLGRDLAGIHFWHKSLTFLGHMRKTGRIRALGKLGPKRLWQQGQGTSCPGGHHHGPGTLQYFNPSPKWFFQRW